MQHTKMYPLSGSTKFVPFLIDPFEDVAAQLFPCSFTIPTATEALTEHCVWWSKANRRRFVTCVITKVASDQQESQPILQPRAKGIA
jgi:hypothetical protein